MALFVRDQKTPGVPAEVSSQGRAARWMERLRDVVLRNPEPPSRSFRYLARLIERELGGRTTGLVLAISGIDKDESPANALLMLAYCLRSELDSRVLMIDARLKDIAGGISGILGLQDAPGYAQIMRAGPGDPKAFIQQTRVAGVDALPAGQPASGTAVALDNATLRHLLDWARGEYDHVLVQVGSALRDTRNATTAVETDAVFLFADEHKTFMKGLDDCRQLLLSNGAHQVKVIVAGGQI